KEKGKIILKTIPKKESKIFATIPDDQAQFEQLITGYATAYQEFVNALYTHRKDKTKAPEEKTVLLQYHPIEPIQTKPPPAVEKQKVSDDPRPLAERALTDPTGQNLTGFGRWLSYLNPCSYRFYPDNITSHLSLHPEAVKNPLSSAFSLTDHLFGEEGRWSTTTDNVWEIPYRQIPPDLISLGITENELVVMKNAINNTAQALNVQFKDPKILARISKEIAAASLLLYRRLTTLQPVASYDPAVDQAMLVYTECLAESASVTPGTKPIEPTGGWGSFYTDTNLLRLHAQTAAAGWLINKWIGIRVRDLVSEFYSGYPAGLRTNTIAGIINKIDLSNVLGPPYTAIGQLARSQLNTFLTMSASDYYEQHPIKILRRVVRQHENDDDIKTLCAEDFSSVKFMTLPPLPQVAPAEPSRPKVVAPVQVTPLEAKDKSGKRISKPKPPPLPAPAQKAAKVTTFQQTVTWLTERAVISGPPTQERRPEHIEAPASVEGTDDAHVELVIPSDLGPIGIGGYLSVEKPADHSIYYVPIYDLALLATQAKYSQRDRTYTMNMMQVRHPSEMDHFYNFQIQLSDTKLKTFLIKTFRTLAVSFKGQEVITLLGLPSEDQTLTAQEESITLLQLINFCREEYITSPPFSVVETAPFHQSSLLVFCLAEGPDTLITEEIIRQVQEKAREKSNHFHSQGWGIIPYDRTSIVREIRRTLFEAYTVGRKLDPRVDREPVLIDPRQINIVAELYNP
ncbi:hypothetical protein MUP32_07095, partial [Candidatus Microgenomates bacterium]|nr:hypothetical protein [Candidatus Microgenomates bacterium]